FLSGALLSDLHLSSLSVASCAANGVVLNVQELRATAGESDVPPLQCRARFRELLLGDQPCQSEDRRESGMKRREEKRREEKRRKKRRGMERRGEESRREERRGEAWRGEEKKGEKRREGRRGEAGGEAWRGEEERRGEEKKGEK
ncbi:hypothetical protein NFI96_021412, partial [Prochilodus magdalenae]